MKALHSFTVRARLPEELAQLEQLATNLRWSWDRPTRELFERLDPALWDQLGGDPLQMIGRLGSARLAELAADPTVTAAVTATGRALDDYLQAPRWFQTHGPAEVSHIAYFSPEFGITEALPQYSGGLGVLAGDHLKAASDLGLPLVGIGLFYRHGYFRQALNVEGWQQERYPDLDPWSLALGRCEQTVTLDLAGEALTVRIWRADVGRVRLYLLDTDVDANPPHLRTITDRLYGGDVEHRLCQEIVLGVGGVRALHALGEPTQLFHTNEGHAGFLGLERIRGLVGEGLAFAEAVEGARAGCLFTTHTPVPAGIDRFPRELIVKYFSGWAAECGVGVDDLMALGHRPGDPPDERFNMAVMGLRLSARSNGVSQLHGEVSREMFADLWPGFDATEAPIGSVTNGVHGQTWTSAEVDDLLSKAVGSAWHEASPQDWEDIWAVPPADVWAMRRSGADRLVAFARERLAQAERDRGTSASEAGWTATAFDPEALTICFSRRFATYKRATLLLSQPERLLALLRDPARPVQFIFAGKAHPADNEGKELIRQIAQFARHHDVRDRFAFIDDYDIRVARALYQGADIWLNNPRRPLEACGTSGEKAALNGALNCSILDGWWAEMFNGQNGWAITSAEQIEDLDERDRREADSLFALLETQIVPLFHERTTGGLPLAWIERMKANWHSLGPRVTAARMVRDYTNGLYGPLAQRAEALAAEHWRRTRELVAWRQHVAAAWTGVHIDTVEPRPETSPLGAAQVVTAQLALGSLQPGDVDVQLLAGPVGEADELALSVTVSMQRNADGPDGHHLYEGSFQPDRAGRYGFTVRVVPAHPDLASVVDLGLVAWAPGA
ncbi:MAG: alpha-glucan family phosphorylase [Acidimicrobiia bacterium]|nr:alpha-glucan family phosphorylase [Acidimicrobiia bacterium]